MKISSEVDEIIRSSCTDVKYSNWTIVPLSVQTAAGILFSHWSVSRQDFQLPFCAANQLQAAETDRGNKEGENQNLYRHRRQTWASMKNTKQISVYKKTCNTTKPNGGSGIHPCLRTTNKWCDRASICVCSIQHLPTQPSSAELHTARLYYLTLVQRFLSKTMRNNPTQIL